MTPVFIYALNCPVTGIVRYCGQTVDPDTRLSGHISLAREAKWYVSRWIKKLVSKKLRPVMEIIDVVPDNEADFWECEYIQNFRERGFKLTNDTDGGYGLRGRFGEKNPFFGRKHTPETIEKQRQAKLGKKHSTEVCAAKREASIGEKNPFFGKKHTPETCAKIRAARTGTKMSPESSAKKRAALTKRRRDEKGRLL